MVTHYRTPAYVSKVLQRVGWPVSGRTLLSWKDKGLLPQLAEHGKGRGKGKVYYWAEHTIVHQALLVAELLSWRSRADSARFLLWLFGYSVSVEEYIQPMFARMLEGVDEYTKSNDSSGEDLEMDLDGDTTGEDKVAVGEDNDEELAERLSTLAVENSLRWRHIPRKVANGDLVRDPQLIEVFLNARLNPAYQPSAEVIDDFLCAAASKSRDGSGASPLTLDSDLQRESISLFQQWVSFISHHVSLPRVRMAALTASLTDWNTAQQDFGRVLSLLIHIGSTGGISPQDFGEFRFNIVQLLGSESIFADLALRRGGYSDIIERALTFVETTIAQVDQERMLSTSAE